LFYLPAITVNGQTERAYDCNNFNSFLNGRTLSTLKSISDSIYIDGTTYIRNDKINDLGEVNVVKRFFDNDRNTSYRLVKEIPSKINKDNIYRKYQQYYKGILVENGGFTVYRENGYVRPSTCNVAPGGSLSSYRSYIFSNINVATASKTTNRQLGSFLNVKNENIRKAALIISPNLTKDCEYRLVWKVDYWHKTNKRAWVDAIDGRIIKTVENIDPSLFAPVAQYGNANGEVFLNDSGTTTPNERILETQDGVLSVYDNVPNPFIDQGCGDGINPSLIPTTINNEWTVNDGSTPAFQTFYVTNILRGIFLTELNIDFLRIHASVGNEDGANADANSDIDETCIRIGRINGLHVPLFDVIAHELGHGIIFDNNINYDNIENRSIHEGVADVLGTYAEAEYEGAIDFEMGDDLDLGVRFLDDPFNGCMNNVVDINDQHTRGQPIGHWYFLTSQGSPNIPAIGRKAPVTILLDALNNITDGHTYYDLMLQTILFAEQNYGRCSDEYLSVARAWDQVCIPHPDPYANNACEFTISGQTSACEENEAMHLTVSGGLASYYYRWQILQPECCYQNVGGTMTNNTQEGGGSLTINQFPDFNSYPQYATVRLNCTNCPDGVPFTIEHTVKIKDCNGSSSDGCRKKLNIDETSIDLNKVENIAIYNLMGKQLYYGSKTALYEIRNYKNNVIIISYFDQEGNRIGSHKHFPLLNW